MKLNLNKDRAWIISVTVVCIALLIGFAMWLNKPEVKSSFSKENTVEEEDKTDEEEEKPTDFYEEEDFGEMSYAFSVEDVKNFDIEIDYATVNIKVDESATEVSVFTHIASSDEEITVNNVGSLIVIRQKSPSDATSSSGSYVEIVLPVNVELTELSLKAIGGVTSIAVDMTHFDYVELSMGTGTMYVDILNADEALVNCKAGMISIKTFLAGNYRIKTSDGGVVEISATTVEDSEDNE